MIKLAVRWEGSCYTPTMTEKLWPAHDYSTVTCDHLLSNTVSSRKEKEIQHKYIQCGKEPRETLRQLNWLNQYGTTKRQELKYVSILTKMVCTDLMWLARTDGNNKPVCVSYLPVQHMSK